jgi:NitT/TauT family transport system substrate-binding protein
VVRLGNLKFAHYGAVSYIKEIAPKCGIKVEERVFAKGLDVMQGIIAGELDGHHRLRSGDFGPRQRRADLCGGRLCQGRRALVSRADLKLKPSKTSRARRSASPAAASRKCCCWPSCRNGLTASDQPGKDVQLVYLAFADLNQALLGKNIDAMMQSEPQSSQAINKGFGRK